MFLAEAVPVTGLRRLSAGLKRAASTIVIYLACTVQAGKVVLLMVIMVLMALMALMVLMYVLQYKEEMLRRDCDFLGPSQFHKLRKSHYGHIKIPKQNGFTRCDTCESLDTALSQATTAQQRESILLDRDYHYDEQQRERQVRTMACTGISLTCESHARSIMTYGKRRNRAAACRAASTRMRVAPPTPS